MDAMGGLYPLRGGAILWRFMSAMPPGSDPKPTAPTVFEYGGPREGSPAAIIWCRILALWMGAWGIYLGSSGLESLVVGLFSRSSSINLAEGIEWFFFVLAQGGIWIAMACYCWIRAPQLADRMARTGDDRPRSHQAISSDELLSTIVIGIGVYLMAEGLPSFARMIFEHLQRFGIMGYWSNIFDQQGFFLALARCALGIFLIFKADWIVRVLCRGRSKDESAPSFAGPLPPPPFIRPESGRRPVAGSGRKDDPMR
jgi:hypothetical protein